MLNCGIYNMEVRWSLFRTRIWSHSIGQMADPREADSLWNELFRRHQGRVALWCLRLTGDREAAADLAQEVFLKAFRYLDSYRGDSKFSTWLYSIARNHCFNEIKSRAAKPEDAGEPMLADLAAADARRAHATGTAGRGANGCATWCAIRSPKSRRG